MLYNDFQSLSEREKSDCLWDNGKPVARFQDAQASFVLYMLEGFYVEVEYKSDFVEMVHLQAYETSNLPERYLDQINISGL